MVKNGQKIRAGVPPLFGQCTKENIFFAGVLPLSNKWNREKLSTYWHTVCKFKSGLTRTIANPLLQVCPTFYFCPSKVFTLCADHSQNVFSFKQTKNLILGWQTGKVFWKNISLAWSFNISICINAVMMEC